MIEVNTRTMEIFFSNGFKSRAVLLSVVSEIPSSSSSSPFQSFDYCYLVILSCAQLDNIWVNISLHSSIPEQWWWPISQSFLDKHTWPLTCCWLDLIFQIFDQMSRINHQHPHHWSCSIEQISLFCFLFFFIFSPNISTCHLFHQDHQFCHWLSEPRTSLI